MPEFHAVFAFFFIPVGCSRHFLRSSEGAVTIGFVLFCFFKNVELKPSRFI